MLLEHDSGSNLEAWEGPGDPLEVTAIAQARYEVDWGGRGRAGCQGEQPYRTLMTGRGNEGEGALGWLLASWPDW